MRIPSWLLAALLVTAGAAAPARAGEGRRAAAVQAAGRTLWRAGASGEQVVTAPVWSRAGDGVAFAVRDRAGRTYLVVVLVGGDADGHVMRWAIPAAAAGAGRPAVSWLGRRRVAVGPSPLRPALVASWQVKVL